MRDWNSLVSHTGLIVEPLGDGITRLSEEIVSLEERSFFYLIEGRERDCLIDGGWGFCLSLDMVRFNPQKPLIAVATHSHFDHIGALYLAGRCFGHAGETEIFSDPDPIATQALPYLADRPVLQGGDTIAPDSIRQVPCPLDRLLSDGDSVDLGDRMLDVFHTPGHSPGSLTLFDRSTGYLFPADVVHDGHIHDNIPGADRAALLLSHRRLVEVDFSLACPGHGALLSPETFRARIEQYRRDSGE